MNALIHGVLSILFKKWPKDVYNDMISYLEIQLLSGVTGGYIRIRFIRDDMQTKKAPGEGCLFYFLDMQLCQFILRYVVAH
ncbi:hypothetical protein ACWWJF_07575 [Symbiopectobacterium sp. Eva_TO]